MPIAAQSWREIRDSLLSLTVFLLNDVQLPYENGIVLSRMCQHFLLSAL